MAAVLVILAGPAAVAWGGDDFLVLCYHDVPRVVSNDTMAVDLGSFVQQLEYLRTHGYNFVGARDILAAHRGTTNLPERAVMLTFDDGYLSFRDHVVPILDEYGYPSLLAICSSWLDNRPPADLTAPLMSWADVRAVASNDLITVASHSHDLHKAVLYNPQGNTGHATASRMWFPSKKRYETAAEFRARIAADLRAAGESLRANAGVETSILVWPYGQYNRPALDEASKLGFEMFFTLQDEKTNTTSDIRAIGRWLVAENPSMPSFISSVRYLVSDRTPNLDTRAAQVDLDLVYDPSPVQTERNLDRLLDRLIAMEVTDVYVQGFRDEDGDGNVSSVYFPNPVLPMKMDLLSRVVNQLVIRGVRAYVWMPVLSVDAPEIRRDPGNLVMRQTWRGPRPVMTGYRRLSPFSDRSRDIMASLYESMAAHVRCSGVLFQDDAYLLDDESFDPAALRAYAKELGLKDFRVDRMTDEQMAEWTRFKADALDAFTADLMEAVRYYRPDALFARTIYAPVMREPGPNRFFAQDYESALELYDYVVVMAYPEMEDVRRPVQWLESLVERASGVPGGLDKTVFKLQAYDWNTRGWMDERKLLNRMRRLVVSGARHVAYYPDDYTIDRPVLKKLRREMSMRTELTLKPRVPADTRRRGMYPGIGK